MNARKKITSLLGGAATIAAVVGMTAGLTPASAAPSQSPGSNLTVVDQNITGAGYNRVIVRGVYPMQKPDAVGYLNNLTAGCGGMHYIVWGDDGNEQYLFDRNYPGVHKDIHGFVRASDRGLEYLQQFVVPASVLNEDTDGTDEVFVPEPASSMVIAEAGFRTPTWSRANSDDSGGPGAANNVAADSSNGARIIPFDRASAKRNSEIPGQRRTCADDRVRTTQSVARHVPESRGLCRAQG